MRKYIDYVYQFQDGNVKGIEFIKNHLAKYLQENQENQTEIEHILDYLYSHPKLDISKIGYTTISAKAEKWIKKLQTLASKDTEVEGTDYAIDFDFDDWYRIVKLLSQDAYNREGKLMSHCVSSYYGRDEVIYSLRDSNNNPHCTISDSSGQIKGKGNGSIDPKYIDYIIQFLESKEIEVSENDMKNLWYYKLSSIDTDLTCEIMYKDYVYVNNIDKIKDKEGNIYCGFGLWDVLGLFTFDLNSKFKINVDIKSTIGYVINLFGGKDYAKLASSGDSAKLASSGHSAQLASSGHYAQLASSGDYAQLASSGDSAKLASSGNFAKIDIQGDNSVGVNIGVNGVIKGVVGSRITLAEYDNKWNCIYVQSAQIDWKKIKADTRYKLENKNFVETTSTLATLYTQR